MKKSIFTNFEALMMLACLFFFAACAKPALENTEAIVNDHATEHQPHEADQTHPQEAVYYDFRGMNEDEVGLALELETEDQLLQRAESYRIAKYLESNGLKNQIEKNMESNQLLDHHVVKDYLDREQQKELMGFVPTDSSRGSCSYYGRSYICVRVSSSSTSSPSPSSASGPPTTIPDQGGGYSYYKIKGCYYVRSGYVHFHHWHYYSGC